MWHCSPSYIRVLHNVANKWRLLSESSSVSNRRSVGLFVCYLIVLLYAEEYSIVQLRRDYHSPAVLKAELLAYANTSYTLWLMRNLASSIQSRVSEDSRCPSAIQHHRWSCRTDDAINSAALRMIPRSLTDTRCTSEHSLETRNGCRNGKRYLGGTSNVARDGLRLAASPRPPKPV